MYIYKLTNKKNGKCYIGQSCRNPEVRWEEHVRSSSSDNYKDKKYIHNAIKKYGWSNFDKEIIEVIPIEKGQKYLDEREFYWILEFKSFVKSGNGYNLTLGGSGTMGSCKSERSKSLTGQTDTYDYANYDPETGKLVNTYLSAREAAEGVGGLRYEHINASADWLIGKGKYAKTYKGYIWMKLPNGEKFPDKINLKKWKNQVRIQPKKRQPKSDSVNKNKNLFEISQYNLVGDLVKVWPNNMALIEREFKTFFPNETIRYNSIVNNLRGKSFTAGGYFWKRLPLGESPDKIPVMSEYKGYNLRQDLLTKEPILMINNLGEVVSEFESIINIPDDVASSYDKVEIYKSVLKNKKYKDNLWIFKKNY